MNKLFILVFFMVVATSGYSQNAAIFSGGGVKILKDKLVFKTIKTIEQGTIDPSLVATPADIGSLYMSDTGGLYVKQDGGTSTNWSLMATQPDFTGNKYLVLAANVGETANEYVDVMKYNNNGLTNLFSNPSGEIAANLDWIGAGCGVVLTSTGTPILSAKSFSHILMSAVGAGTCTADLLGSAQMKGLQGVFTGYFNATQENTSKIQVEIDGVVVAELDILKKTSLTKYEIPFVFGSVSTKILIVHTGANTLTVDELYAGVGKVTETVGQAHFVGKLDLSNNCQYVRSAVGYDYMLDNDSACSATEAIGGVSLPTFTNRAGVKILNVRTDGYYKVAFSGLLLRSGTAGSCEFTFSKTNSLSDNGEAFIGNSLSNSSLSWLGASIRFNPGEDEAYILASSTAGDTCRVYGQAGNTGAITVHFFPDSSATIVSQDTELTELTANTLTATITGAGTLLRTNYDWITGISGSAGDYTITIKAGVFSETPSCNATANWIGSIRNAAIINSGLSATSIRVSTHLNNATSVSAQQFMITCVKTGDAVNKSATIVGKFENINSSELIEISLRGTVGQTLTDATFTRINYDTKDREVGCTNCFDLSTDLFTSPRSTKYMVCPKVLTAGSSWTDNDTITARLAFSVQNPIDVERSETNSSWSGLIHTGKCQEVSMAENETMEFTVAISRGGNTGTQAGNWNRLSITELPDTESIIKNLATDSKIECQTKYLQATTVVTNAIIPDLTFTNLDTTKTYYFNMGFSFNGCASIALDNGVQLAQFAATSGIGIASRVFKYKPTGDLTIQTGGTCGSVFGDGTRSQTYLELCELSGNYVETTKF